MIHAASAAIVQPLLRMGLRLEGGQQVATARPEKRAALRALSILQSRLDEIALVVRET